MQSMEEVKSVLTKIDPINIAISKEQSPSVIEYSFIVWADQNARKIIGVTFDKPMGQKVKNRELLIYLVEKITSSNLPLVLIDHDFRSKNIEVIDCNIDRTCRYKVSADELEELIVRKFLIGDSSNREHIKPVNVRERVHDGFHKWSRSAFGSKVKKVDIDCLLFKDRVMVTIEVKNTSRSQISIDRWQPYTNDQDNYKIVGLFSEQVLNCDFITLQHPLKHDSELKSEDINVGVWNYNSELNFTQFRSDRNRKKMTFSQVVSHYMKKDDL